MIVEAIAGSDMESPADRREFWPRVATKETRHAGHTRLGETLKPGSARGLRRDRHRRRDFRPVYALPPARTGHDRAGLRGRHERWRHLVLEPLSRRALRFRKLDLWLFLFQGADGGMELEGALLPPARHAGIPELRRRQVRPTPGHTVPQHGRGRALG